MFQLKMSGFPDLFLSHWIDRHSVLFNTVLFIVLTASFCLAFLYFFARIYLKHYYYSCFTVLFYLFLSISTYMVFSVFYVCVTVISIITANTFSSIIIVLFYSKWVLRFPIGCLKPCLVLSHLLCGHVLLKHLSFVLPEKDE